MRWQDIHRSEPLVITPPAFEPLSRAEARRHARIPDGDAEDAWVDRAIRSARRQVEHDLDMTLVRTVLEMVFDRFPTSARGFSLPRPPLISVTSITSFNDAGTESTMSSSDYLVDTHSRPGRVLLAPSAAWPSNVRTRLGGKIRWTAGHSAVAQTVSSLTRSAATATATTSAAHGYTSGQRVTIAGADQDDYNGTFEVTVTGATTFTFTVLNSPATPATGAITAADLGVPERYTQAMALLIGSWYEHREAVTDDPRHVVPFGYDALLADRVVGF